LIVSDAEAASLAEELFGVRGDAHGLIGEYDQNFRIRDARGRRYLLKLTPPHIEMQRVAFQNALLEHLAAKAPDLNVPRLIRTRTGDPLWTDEPRGGQVVRMLAWVDGTAYCDYEPKTAALRFSLGAFVAKLTEALDSFEYADAPRGHMWDLARADQHRSSSRFVAERESRRRVEDILERFLVEVRPALEKLPGHPVHGDINDSNVLVADGSGEGAKWGLIDFGDAAWSHAIRWWVVCVGYPSLWRSASTFSVRSASVACGTPMPLFRFSMSPGRRSRRGSLRFSRHLSHKHSRF